jgi:hypothetical protein
MFPRQFFIPMPQSGRLLSSSLPSDLEPNQEQGDNENYKVTYLWNIKMSRLL